MKHGTNHYNAIVVGAGPAGCSAAYYLKKSGKSVLMLDKMDFQAQTMRRRNNEENTKTSPY